MPGGAEVRGLGRDADVGGGGQAEPAADRGAVHRRDHRLVHVADGEDHVVEHLHRASGDAGALQPRDVRHHAAADEVGAGAEAVAGAGEHDDPALVVEADLAQRVAQRDHHVERHRVHAFGTVQRDQRDVRPRVVDLDEGHGAESTAGRRPPPPGPSAAWRCRRGSPDRRCHRARRACCAHRRPRGWRRPGPTSPRGSSRGSAGRTRHRPARTHDRDRLVDELARSDEPVERVLEHPGHLVRVPGSRSPRRRHRDRGRNPATAPAPARRPDRGCSAARRRSTAPAIVMPAGVAMPRAAVPRSTTRTGGCRRRSRCAPPVRSTGIDDRAGRHMVVRTPVVGQRDRCGSSEPAIALEVRRVRRLEVRGRARVDVHRRWCAMRPTEPFPACRGGSRPRRGTSAGRSDAPGRCGRSPRAPTSSVPHHVRRTRVQLLVVVELRRARWRPDGDRGAVGHSCTDRCGGPQ